MARKRNLQEGKDLLNLERLIIENFASERGDCEGTFMKKQVSDKKLRTDLQEVSCTKEWRRFISIVENVVKRLFTFCYVFFCFFDQEVKDCFPIKLSPKLSI